MGNDGLHIAHLDDTAIAYASVRSNNLYVVESGVGLDLLVVDVELLEGSVEELFVTEWRKEVLTFVQNGVSV